MAHDTLHVVPHDDGWAVKREGNDRSSSTHDTQKDAIEAARVMAKEGDELVIHRTDGTVREQSTYSGSATETNGREAAAASEVRVSDVASVGTRVSWGAVFAGVIVALAVYVSLNLFAFAIGVSTIDRMGTKTVALGAAVVSTACFLVALFMGGYVASRSTVGEEKTEAMTYGVLVWATILLLLVATGFSFGVGAFAGLRDIGEPGGQRIVSVNAPSDLGLADSVSPEALAWWTFGGVVASALAAVAGSLVGAGPELVLKQWNDRRLAVATRPS